LFDLSGLSAVVTGGASGIGEQISRAFASCGARVMIADIDGERAEGVAREIGHGAAHRAMDVRDSASVQAALEAAYVRFGTLDVLVNNAGIPLVGNVEQTAEEDFRRLLDVNVLGVFHGCKHAVPIMLRQGQGNIINIASVAGLIAVEKRFAYCATKGAVIAMTRSLAIDYATQGIRCNAIAPGTVHTPFVDRYVREHYADKQEETFAALHARQPIGRMGRPDEIAAMAVYLASRESAFVTGSILTIDGGWTAR
jgi:NAD(P)-dependent dehydrogenase (short-subunit alcohol dehydrogenase family)